MRITVLIALSIIVLLCQCASWTKQDTKTVVTVAQDLLHFVAGLLARADIAQSTTFATSPARMQLDDSVERVIAARLVYKSNPTEYNQIQLEQTAQELEFLLEKETK